ncbi:MAG: hypothetical protein Q9172_007392 [Xanthocarpia lactea]
MAASWQQTAGRVQAYRLQSISKIQPAIPDLPLQLPKNVTAVPQQLLTQQELEITQSSVECLLACLSTGTWTSKTVTLAFLRRAAIAQNLVNCVTELLPEQALARAAELDLYLAEHKRPIGPLHGLPISVKEYIGMKGLTCNASFVTWADQYATEDAMILKILWEAGCIFHARTTQPQTIMHLETSSNLYGVTVNPYNTDLTSGGSSGGEGALIGLRGSCLGLGSDIANGGSYIAGTLGPLSTDLEGIEIMMKVILASKPWIIDPTLVPIPWRDNSCEAERSRRRRIKIGIMRSDDVVTPHPSVTRGLEMMVARLKNLEEVETVDWKPYDHKQAWEITASLYFVDGGKQIGDLIASSADRTRADIQGLVKIKERYRLEYSNRWNETGNGQLDDMIDVILCPATPGPASFLDCSKYWGYTSQWNLLDYPALVFPVTKFDSKIDRWPSSYVAMNDQDQYNIDLYQPAKAFDGMPISLQLVGRSFNDKKASI